jgi:hypothetical protein
VIEKNKSTHRGCFFVTSWELDENNEERVESPARYLVILGLDFGFWSNLRLRHT